MRTQIIEAIKNFDINKLQTLLDDERSYMDVSKSLFLKTLEKEFESAKKDGCHSFDDVFFGICESCNKGCEGMTFYSNSGYYLDIYMEDDNEAVNNIYVCNKLTNFTDLKKTQDLGFSFYLDEAVLFKPDEEYIIIENQYKSLLEDVELFSLPIRLDHFVIWYDGYSYIRNFIDKKGFYRTLDYDLYSRAFSLIRDIDKIVKLKTKAHHAVDALITFQKAKTEREKLIWFFENRTDHNGTIYFCFPGSLWIERYTIFESSNVNIKLDLSGYEFVMDYFQKLDNFFNELMEKYMPSDELFVEAGEEGLIYSIENYLTIHNVHLDLLKKYGRDTF